MKFKLIKILCQNVSIIKSMMMTGIIMTKENVKIDKSTMKKTMPIPNKEDLLVRIWVHREVNKVAIKVRKADSKTQDLQKTSKVLEGEHRVLKMMR